MMEKSIFVRQFLKPMLIAADNAITNVIYQNTERNGEYVHVYVRGTALAHINVTGDSPLQIAKDVLKKIEV